MDNLFKKDSIKRRTISFFFVLIITLLSTFSVASESDNLNIQEKFNKYVESLIRGDLNGFFNYNAEFIIEKNKIKKDFPKIMWEEKFTILRKKWEKKLLNSIGIVKKKRLWDYLYEPNSNVKATILEIRIDQEKAFIKVEYPNIETAPNESDVTSPGIKAIILIMKINSDTFDQQDILALKDSLQFYPFKVPNSLESCINDLLLQQINSIPKSVSINREICFKNSFKDENQKKEKLLSFLQTEGFKIYEKINIRQDHDSFMQCRELIHPSSWKDFIISSLLTNNNPTKAGIEYFIFQKSSIKIKNIIMKDTSSGHVIFIYHCSGTNPIYKFITKFNQLLGKGYINLVKLCSITNFARFYGFENGQTYIAQCKYSQKNGWQLQKQLKHYFKKFNKDKNIIKSN